jgi:molybdate transport system regulatory protein
MKSASSNIQPRFRVNCGRNIAIGPGKAELLEHVQRAGSISEAARRMGMSYMRAWTLVKTMERSFKKPLVAVVRGGAKHGGAELTENGKRVLELYRKMESDSLKATAATRRRIIRMLAM